MANEPVTYTIEPELGGHVTVGVHGWCGWHVWIDVTGYEDHAHNGDIPLDPGQAIRTAVNLLKAAVICWWRARKDPARG